jgi:asparagine synthase (glutamine-hydrolysing)
VVVYQCLTPCAQAQGPDNQISAPPGPGWRVPPGILRRGKKGFNIPVAQWLVGELRELAGDLLSPAALRRQGYFRAEYVQRLWQEHQTRRRDHRKLLWTLLSFQLWHSTYMH